MASGVRLRIYGEGADAVVARALEAGAALAQVVADQFHGDRSGLIVDPFRHRWSIATRIEMVDPEEMQRRFTGAMEPAEPGA